MSQKKLKDCKDERDDEENKEKEVVYQDQKLMELKKI